MRREQLRALLDTVALGPFMRWVYELGKAGLCPEEIEREWQTKRAQSAPYTLKRKRVQRAPGKEQQP